MCASRNLPEDDADGKFHQVSAIWGINSRLQPRNSAGVVVSICGATTTIAGARSASDDTKDNWIPLSLLSESKITHLAANNVRREPQASGPPARGIYFVAPIAIRLLTQLSA